MSERRERIIEELNRSAAETIDFYTSLAPDELSVRVYADGARWSVRQVLAHLVTIEKSMQWLFDNIMSGGPGSPEDFDFERFNRSQPQKLDDLSLVELIARFENVRAATTAMVAEMTDADLDQQGRHSFHGPGRLERFVRWAYEHNRLHLADVRNALG